MIFASRTGEDFIDPVVVANLEPLVGKACLEAVVGFHLDDAVSFHGGFVLEGPSKHCS